MKKYSGFQIVIAVFLSMVFLVLTNCKHEIIHPQNTSQPTGNVQDTSICFERDILPLFISNCATVGCHDATYMADGYNLTSYNSIMSRGIVQGKPSSSKLYRVMSNGSMPPTTTMPQDQIALIKKWILQGAKNGTNCPSTCDSMKFTFSGSIKPMMGTYCVGCHSGANSGGGIALDTYSGVASAAKSGRLWGSVCGLTGYSFMPKGGNSLSACQKAQIKKWIDAGLPNN